VVGSACDSAPALRCPLQVAAPPASAALLRRRPYESPYNDPSLPDRTRPPLAAAFLGAHGLDGRHPSGRAPDVESALHLSASCLDRLSLGCARTPASNSIRKDSAAIVRTHAPIIGSEGSPRRRHLARAAPSGDLVAACHTSRSLRRGARIGDRDVLRRKSRGG
jgi:hypothetical protein